MRRRLAEYSVSGAVISLQESVNIQDIRLIFDETTGECVCSSSQKDKVYVSIGGRNIMILDGKSRTNHELTIEIDNGSSLEGVKSSVSVDIDMQTEEITNSVNQAAESNKNEILTAIREISTYEPEYAQEQDIRDLFQ